MKNKCTVLVTGVGAIIGYGIVKSLRASLYQCYIVGIDIYSDAVGKVWCDSFVAGVKADSKDFQDHIQRVVKQYSIDLIIPGIEQDLQALAIIRDTLSELGVVVALNSSYCLNTFGSKLNTRQFLLDNCLPVLETLSAKNANSIEVSKSLGYPCIAKLDKSTAGKGQRIIHDETDLAPFLGQSEYLLQRYVNSSIVKEFTASAFGLGNGDFVNLITLERTLGSDGATHKAKVTSNEPFIQQIRIICNNSRPVGPTNFQFIYDDSQNEYFLLEINPRISSSSSLRTAFGVNEAQMCIDYYLHKCIPETSVIRSGKAQRYIADNVEYDSSDF
ncbi:ATP-binding protein [Planctobacterium marinum]|uniref:ATP-binding protein n=1 Tax=Planctobacterium marinum TaxID=1631968 RepID=UPI001E59096F|nr:ATP-grasp domain-containing protein [Planctobacterium marinum]MCC2606118.1 ATP-grasp domain-containing protein [Planctobacterium marinum]